MLPPTRKTGAALALLAGSIALSAQAGCFALGAGLEPPQDQFYYPTALLTSPGGRTLYVVNSDFDIQYTGGTVQAIDLAGLRACAGRLRDNLARGASALIACGDIGLGESANPVLVPGPCEPIPVNDPVACTLTDDPDTAAVEGEVAGPLVHGARVIGAFASSAALARDPSGPGARLFVAVRGEPTVTFFDVTDDAEAPDADPFRLDCATETDDNRCGEDHRIGESPADSSREITLPVEPVGIAANDDGRTITTVHQTTASASLLINKWDVLPTLEHTLGGLPPGPSDLAAIPTPRVVLASAAAGQAIDYRPGFIVSYRASRSVDIVRLYDDSESTLGRHFLQRVGTFGIGTNSDGADSRGVAVDGSERAACEEACGDEIACLRGCAAIPMGVFIANRAPASLVVGQLETTLIEEGGVVTGASDSIRIIDMVPLTSGPSRVVVGDALDADGRRAPRVLAASFDSRYLVIYDPRLRRVEAVVRTGRGPHALAVDVAEDTAEGRGHALVYVAHFTDSYVGVVDLDTRNARTYGSMFAAAGKPTPPKESN